MPAADAALERRIDEGTARLHSLLPNRRLESFARQAQASLSHQNHSSPATDTALCCIAQAAKPSSALRTP